MSESTPPGSYNPLSAELKQLQKSWGWLMAFGIALILIGVMAVGSAFITTFVTVYVFGTLAIIGGIVEIISAFWMRSSRGFFVHILAGILYFVLGLLIIEHPGITVAGLTLLLAGLLIVGGLLRIIFAFAERFDGWLWVLVSGSVSLLLGTTIWRGWPESSLWVIGLFIGIEIIFCGISWVMLAMMAKSIKPPEGTHSQTTPAIG